MDDTNKTGTPAWYFDQLLKGLEGKRQRLTDLSDYLDGNAPLPESNARMRKAYRDFQHKARTNFAEIIVDLHTPPSVAKSDRDSFFRLALANYLSIEFSDYFLRG